MRFSDYPSFRRHFRRALIKRGRSPRTGRIHKGIFRQQYRRALAALEKGIIDPTHRPTEQQAIENVLRDAERYTALKRVTTPLETLSRVWYWDREYLKTHRCRCTGVSYRSGSFILRDSTRCVCFSSVTESRARYIALRAFVLEDMVEYMLDEIENIARFCAAEGYAEPFAYEPSAIELTRVGKALREKALYVTIGAGS